MVFNPEQIFKKHLTIERVNIVFHILSAKNNIASCPHLEMIMLIWMATVYIVSVELSFTFICNMYN